MESYPNIPHPSPTQHTAHSKAQLTAEHSREQRAESREQRCCVLCALWEQTRKIKNKKQNEDEKIFKILVTA